MYEYDGQSDMENILGIFILKRWLQIDEKHYHVIWVVVHVIFDNNMSTKFINDQLNNCNID